MKKSNILVLAIASVLAAGVAIAAPATAPAQKARVDANGDGVISRAEAAAHPRLAERFDQLDKNRDGRLDASERPQFKGRGHRGGGMAMLDANKDGVIDRTEAAKFPKFAQRFDHLDKNRDGRLDASERPQRMGRGGGMAKIDKNGDGRISRNEAVGSPFAQRFDQLDANRDSYITREEMRASFQKMREARATAPAVR